jgi:hypothetical protein
MAAVVITAKDAGKTVKASPGQRIEVRLKGDQPLTGWEEITIPQRGVLEFLDSELRHDPAAKDAAIGTYVFHYRALKDGTVPLKFDYVYPGGPEVEARKATKLVAEFKVTLEVRTGR